MRALLLLLVSLVGGCSLSQDVDILKIKNEIAELKDMMESNNQLDRQNWLLDIYQQKQMESIMKELDRKRI